MFPSRRHHRFSTALLEVAEAMLRPVPLEDDRPAAGDDAWQWPVRPDSGAAQAQHPHRRAARIERQRRPGTTARPAQHCTTPQPSRTPRDPRPATA